MGKLNMAIVLRDDSDPANLSQIDKQKSSFAIIEGQKYRKSRYASSRAVLTRLGEELNRRGTMLTLVNSCNNKGYGASDK